MVQYSLPSDVTAWVREVKHWTNTEERFNIKVKISLKLFNIKPQNLEYGFII